MSSSLQPPWVISPPPSPGWLTPGWFYFPTPWVSCFICKMEGQCGSGKLVCFSRFTTLNSILLKFKGLSIVICAYEACNDIYQIMIYLVFSFFTIRCVILPPGLIAIFHPSRFVIFQTTIPPPNILEGGDTCWFYKKSEVKSSYQLLRFTWIPYLIFSHFIIYSTWISFWKMQLE